MSDLPVEDRRSFEKKTLEAAIRIAVVGTLVVWTYRIVEPFLMPVIWGIILAVAVDPFVTKMNRAVGGSRKLIATLLAIVVVAALVVPMVKLSASTVGALQGLVNESGKLTVEIPPPPDSVKQWPLVGNKVFDTWLMASSNLKALLKNHAPQVKAAVAWAAGTLGGGLKAMLMFIVSVIIAAAFLATSEKGSATVSKIIRRIAGEREPEIKSLATATIRGVMLGVVGVAVIQSLLAVAGLMVAGIPLIGVWGILVLICAVIQLPPILVLGPIAAWYFTVADTSHAVAFLIWSVIVSSSDGFLKPLLIGRGVDIPMLVILIGALGGMVLSGIIGLFIGAVVVAISYKLFMAWLEEGQEA